MRTSLQSLPGKNILNQVGSTTSTIATTILHSEGFSLLILYNNTLHPTVMQMEIRLAELIPRGLSLRDLQNSLALPLEL